MTAEIEEAKRSKLDLEIMETLRNCPICVEIPEKEIYQCSAGHVICHLCISKVSGRLCPQCRVPFGRTKIRNRVMEQLLDAQNFPCKFEDKGCNQLSKRQDITIHYKLCSYNPDLIPLCKQMGYENCTFKQGACSRDEVISHFSNVHSSTYMPIQSYRLQWGNIVGDTFLQGKTGGVGISHCSDDAETGPVFLHLIYINRPIGYLSFFCINVWNSGSNPVQNYEVEYSFNKGPANSPQPQAVNSNWPLVENDVGTPILSWTIKVYDIKEAVRLIKEPPIKASISLLNSNLRRDNKEDCIIIKISSVG